MGSTGLSARPVNTGNQTVTSNFKDGRNIVDSKLSMSDALFSSMNALLTTIENADGGRFDLLDFRGDNSSGSAMYTDSFASDGIAFDVTWQRNYGEEGGIRIISFKELEEGEW